MERKALRILDANYNRAREALRTAEEYCRFVLEDQRLAGQAKNIRHQLSSIMSNWDAQQLISERDTASDVGRDLKIDSAQGRLCLADCFTAAVKRAGEALRVLAETAQIDSGTLSVQFEQLRFEIYALEKDVLQGLPRHRFHDVRLYVLIPALPQMADSQVLDIAGACAEGGADALQLRAVGIEDDRLFKLSKKFVSLCKAGRVLIIINNRADIAALTEADGLHLGRHDLPCSQAKKLLFRPALIGLSTHSENELRAAIDAGADYVGIGACFPSPTKPEVAVSGLDYVKKALALLKETSIGHVAIGGITAENLPTLLEAGVRAAAVSSAVCAAEDPRVACRQFKELLLQKNP